MATESSDGRTQDKSARAAHVNMMTDTIIANLPIDGLRSIIRGLLGVDSKVTPAFHDLAAKYLENTKPSSTPTLFEDTSAGRQVLPAFYEWQCRYRCLMGCGDGFGTLAALCEVVSRVRLLNRDPSSAEGQKFMDVLATIDSDVVQASTAVQKQLSTSIGQRPMSKTELEIVKDLRDAILSTKKHAESHSNEFAFQRGLSRLGNLGQNSGRQLTPSSRTKTPRKFTSGATTLETVQLGDTIVPRMFMGLWQFSSPAWGTAPRGNIHHDFRKHVDSGFIAYDMADHYGDAEVTFGQFRSSQPDSNHIYCATKWCVFSHINVSKDVVRAQVTERLIGLDTNSIELLQFHWQDYDDHQYIKAAKLLEEDPRVESLGLCNFDTQRMDEIIESGIKIVSNQVQFSLIDLRPTFKMADSCRKYNVKLLTYGSLCGGLLADKWLGQPAPNFFDEDMTPSHRKYLEMISVWGRWILFQELLSILSVIGKKYDVSISAVAIRWVLDHDYVGAVIIGARMGVSEHTEENLKVFSFKLDEKDKSLIQKVLDRCRAREVAEAMGDCGSEYRQ